MAYVKKLETGKYFVRVSKGTGKNREQYSSIIRGNLKDAQKWAREHETKLDLGQPVKSNSITFAEYYQIWKKKIKRQIAPKTYDSYIWNIETFCLKRFGKVRLDRIKRTQIQSLLDAAADQGYKRNSLNNLRGVLGKFFKDAVKQERLTISPCNYLELPKADAGKILVLDEKETALFIRHCQHHPFGLVFELALETGMRPNEYLALKWDNIDWQRRTLSVERGVQWTRDKKYYFKEPKTAGSVRTVEITSNLIERLKHHRVEQLKQKMKLGGLYAKLDLIFASDSGLPLKLYDLNYKHLKPLLRSIGIKKNITLKCLRHTCATLLLLEGLNVKVVSERLGHSNSSITLNVYSHVIPTMQEQATVKLDQILRGA